MTCKAFDEVNGLRRRVAAAIQATDPQRAASLRYRIRQDEESAAFSNILRTHGDQTATDIALASGRASEVAQLREELEALTTAAVEDRAATIADLDATVKP